MKGNDGMDNGGNTMSFFLSFMHKIGKSMKERSDMKLHGSPMASRCLSREIGDLLGRKGDYAQAPEEDGMVVPHCDIQTLAVLTCMTHIKGKIFSA